VGVFVVDNHNPVVGGQVNVDFYGIGTVFPGEPGCSHSILRSIKGCTAMGNIIILGLQYVNRHKQKKSRHESHSRIYFSRRYLLCINFSPIRVKNLVLLH